jgi:GxxExxY protein
MDVDRVTAAIVDSAMKVHSALGPGLLESIYEKCLEHELTSAASRLILSYGCR